MTDKVMAFAALMGTLVNIAMLIMHCRRDQREFKRLERPEESR